jgi:DAACS family dicarboxylate/amino acid:cation (Na+ or H+) symporter
MSDESSVRDATPPEAQRALPFPLYLRILVALLFGCVVGAVLGPRAHWLELPARLILRCLAAVAPVLILLAIMRSIITANIRGRVAGRLLGLLLVNTLVAIGVGLFVANALGPGTGSAIVLPASQRALPAGIVDQVLSQIPDSLFRPFVENNVIGVVLIAAAFGLAVRQLGEDARRFTETFTSVALDATGVVLSWLIALVPLAVFGKVAGVVGVSGFAAFSALGRFLGAVLLALVLQAGYYLARIRLGSWVSPRRLLRETRDALVMAFSTASSTITMPITYERLVRGVGLRAESASLGALVGSNFNNDGTALYEAMAALFVAQLTGHHLSLFEQLTVVVTSVIASVGAAGIPEAGLVTMTLVFTAVHLPTEYIAVLLTVDWFLDRCRTTINVLGDMTVSCLLDGRVRSEEMVSTRLPSESTLPSA